MVRLPRCRCDSASPQDAGRDVSSIEALILAGKLLQPLTQHIEDGTAYSWCTETALRVLLKLENGHESDVVVDLVTQCFRGWVDGVEVGGPELN